MRFRLRYICLLTVGLLLGTVLKGYSQKVGLVLSGGGATGLTHIGVIKALEENNIPIDYITGTSMGALIGAMYVSGYSTAEMEALVKSQQFKDWVSGNIEEKYAYYFKQKPNDASWINLKVSLDSTFQLGLPTNIVSPIPMNFALLQILAAPAAASNYNFDSLMIPFRCVASDIANKRKVIFKKGDLGQAIRASTSYPFYLKPIRIDGNLLFDGGLYENFPISVMDKEFDPDFIIGSNLNTVTPPPDEDDPISQIRSILLNPQADDLPCENGVILRPQTTVGLFEFDDPRPTIDSGYQATMRQMEFIKSRVQKRMNAMELAAKREEFKQKMHKLIIDDIHIQGLNRKQSEYVKHIISYRNRAIDLETLKKGYYRISADSKIKSIYPTLLLKPETGTYSLELNIKKERNFVTSFGGNFSNKPISMGFGSVQYNYLGRVAIGVSGNLYFGKLYSSAQLKSRIDFPFNIPVYLEPVLTLNRWDYFKSSNAFFEDKKPSYLVQYEQFGELNIGFSTGRKGRLIASQSYSELKDSYYQIENFSIADTADETNFKTLSTKLSFEQNTLNRRQYASQGNALQVSARYINGEELNKPGSTLPIEDLSFRRKVHEWILLKIKYEQYIPLGTFKAGFLAEGVYSTQTLFNNYTASILSAPAFMPTPETQTFFIADYRAHKYLAGGMRNIFSVLKVLDFRIEGYVMIPYQQLIPIANYQAGYGVEFATKHYLANSTLVYHSPLGPVSVGVNYYDKKEKPWSFLFHFGYIIFNKRALE